MVYNIGKEESAVILPFLSGIIWPHSGKENLFAAGNCAIVKKYVRYLSDRKGRMPQRGEIL